MKYFIYILFFLGVVFSQDKKVTLPESEVIKWAQSLQKFEKSDSLQKVLISDLELQIRLLEENSFSDSLIISNQELHETIDRINLRKKVLVSIHRHGNNSFKSKGKCEFIPYKSVGEVSKWS